MPAITDYMKIAPPVRGTLPPSPVRIGPVAHKMVTEGGDGGVPPPVVAPPAGPVPGAGVVTAPPTPGGWKMPDYGSMIPGDWEVLAAQAEAGKLTGEAEANFQRMLRQAFIDYGGDAARLGDYAKYIDAATIEAARNNKFSQTAQNLAAMTRGLRNQRARNASMGMSTSGRSVGQTRRALEGREQADYGALRTFLSGAGEGNERLASVRQQIADRIAAARASAAARLAQQYPGEYVEGTPGVATDALDPAIRSGAAAPWAGISWGGRSGITTVAQMKAALGPGVSYATWAARHPDAARRLRGG